MTFAGIEAKVATTGLAVVGAFHPAPDDGVPDGIQSLILLGPAGPEMWQAFSASPEYSDSDAHPMDRWSTRVIDALAEELEAVSMFPFGGPPWQPFQQWAFKGEGAVTSPVSMQVTWRRGLWTSFRGALGLRDRIDLPGTPNVSPCVGCDSPCLTACPVDAFAGGNYDVQTCTQHLKSGEGAACLQGCLVRAACPYGDGLDLPLAQRAFHIDAFLRSNG